MRQDEDYSYLKNDTAANWYTKLKYSPLAKGRNSFISYGGEVRFQYFYSHNEGWGDEPKDSNGYILSRFLAHADLHAGKHFRTFVQLQSSLSGSRIAPSPVEDNALELHQAFADYSGHISPELKFIFRAGRQELLYGSQRLVSVRDNPNNRQSFDGLRSILLWKKYRMDLFFTHSVAARKGLLNDGWNHTTKFWGAYVVKSKLPVLKNIDVYYLGLWKRASKFDDGMGKELRHSLGTRLWNTQGNWQYDFEALYQFGKFAGKDIAAWTASVSTSYRFNRVKLQPEVGLKTELISGDTHYEDTRLQTFNPLFPRGAYFGLAALIGPANLIDAHPSLSLNFSSKLNLNLDYDVFRRYNRNDGLYATNMSLIYSGKKTTEKDIGKQLAGSLVYTPNNFIYFRTEFTWFDAGKFLKEAGSGKDILFAGITTQLKF